MQHGEDLAKRDGEAQSGWVVLDYGEIMVHIMTPAMRSRYTLESKWRDAERVDLAPILGAHPPSTDASAQQTSSLTSPSWDADPFWS